MALFIRKARCQAFLSASPNNAHNTGDSGESEDVAKNFDLLSPPTGSESKLKKSFHPTIMVAKMIGKVELNSDGLPGTDRAWDSD
jgi:hypothetical protein